MSGSATGRRTSTRIVLRRRSLKPLMHCRRHRLVALVAQGALPDHRHAPSDHEQLYTVPRVARDVRLELRCPERLSSRRRRGVTATGVAMPEAPVHEACGAKARKDDVRPSGQPPIMQPVTQTARMQRTPQTNLGLSVPPTDA